MGYVGGESVPAVPAGDRLCNRWQVFQDHEQVGLAPARFAKAD